MTQARARRDSLAHRIAQLRQKLGLTQVAFAHRVGVSRGTIGLYEAGTLAPRARTLDRIAEIGGVTADWLLRGDRPVASPPARDTRPGYGPARASALSCWLQAVAAVRVGRALRRP